MGIVVLMFGFDFGEQASIFDFSPSTCVPKPTRPDLAIQLRICENESFVGMENWRLPLLLLNFSDVVRVER